MEEPRNHWLPATIFGIGAGVVLWLVGWGGLAAYAAGFLIGGVGTVFNAAHRSYR